MFDFLKRKKKEVYDPSKDDSRRPITATVALGDVNDKYSEYPSNGLTPRRLAAIFREADQGSVLRQMELFEEMEEKDTHLYSQLQTRKLAVAGKEWKIQPYSEDERDKEVAEFVSDTLKAIEDFDDKLLDFLDAIGKGISFSEISWRRGKQGNAIIDDIGWVHPKKFHWDSVTDEIKVTTKEYPSGIALPRNKFVIHRYKARSGHESRQGILRVISWMYLFKNYDLKDWVSFCEVYGMPLRLGKYDASASQQDKEDLMSAIFNLGADAAGIVPSNTMIEFIESNKTSTVDIYEKLARYCDEQMSKAVLGQTLTSDSGGSHAQSKTHDEVRHDLTKADCKAVATTIRRDLIRPLVEYNFGYDIDIPYFEIAYEEKEELKELVEVFDKLVDMDLKIPTEYVYKKFNIPVPEEGETVLQRINQRKTDYNEEPYSLTLKEDNSEGEIINIKHKPQQNLDRLVEIASEKSESLLEGMMKPLLNLIDSSADMTELQNTLQDEEAVKKLYQQMENKDFGDLVEEATYISHLIGRNEKT